MSTGTFPRASDDRTDLFRPGYCPPPVPVPEIAPGEVWGRVTCLPADEMPDRLTDSLPRGFWLPLINEIVLRLECTRRADALRIPFQDAAFAYRGRNALIKVISRLKGNNAIETRLQDNVVYIRRGTGWPVPFLDRNQGD